MKLYSEEIRPLPEESLGGGSSGAKAARVSVADPGIDDDDDDKYPKDNYNRKVILPLLSVNMKSILLQKLF